MKRLVIALTIVVAASPAAAQEPKNVQLLKGLTPTQLQRTMNMMRASLGVHCDFCHVMKDNNWDFASDEKDEKKVARKMIQMTMDLNNNVFKRTAVSCNSCHRGSLHPVALPGLPQTPPPFPTPAEQRPALPARDEVVAKYAAAIGNPTPAAVSSMEMKGVRESPRGNAPIDVIVAPGKTRINATTPEGELVNVITDSGGWMRDARGTRALTPGQIEHMSQLADAVRFIYPADIPADAKVTGKEKVGDKDAWIITMPWGTLGRQRLYFDTQTGLLLRRVTMMQTSIGWVPQQTDYDDYRSAGAVKLPFIVRFDSIDPWIGATRRYSEIRLNPNIESTVFDQPPTQ